MVAKPKTPNVGKRRTRCQQLLSEAEKLANIGSFEWDILRNKVTWSEGLYHIYGLDPQQFGVSLEAFLERVHPKFRRRVKKTIDTAFQQGKPFQMEERIVRADGKVRVLFSKGEVVKDQAGRAVRLIGVCQDITEQRQAERARVKSMQLRAEMRQLQKFLKQLQEAQAQLIQSEKLASLGSLIAGILHEMNSPIGVVKSAVDVSNRCISNVLKELSAHHLLAKLPTSRKALEVLEDNAGLIEKANERILAIVTSLKSFAKLDDDAPQQADIHESLDSVLTLLDHRFADRIQLEKQYGKVPKILSYPGELNQAFMNILMNAVEAIPAQGSITIRTFTEDPHVVVEFTDTGVGIAADRMGRLFDPAFSRKGARIKAGVGLFTTLNIIDKHHGYIKAESTVGKGSTLFVHLPRTFPKEPIAI